MQLFLPYICYFNFLSFNGKLLSSVAVKFYILCSLSCRMNRKQSATAFFCDYWMETRSGNLVRYELQVHSSLHTPAASKRFLNRTAGVFVCFIKFFVSVFSFTVASKITNNTHWQFYNRITEISRPLSVSLVINSSFQHSILEFTKLRKKNKIRNSDEWSHECLSYRG